MVYMYFCRLRDLVGVVVLANSRMDAVSIIVAKETCP